MPAERLQHTCTEILVLEKLHYVTVLISRQSLFCIEWSLE